MHKTKHTKKHQQHLQGFVEKPTTYQVHVIKKNFINQN